MVRSLEESKDWVGVEVIDKSCCWVKALDLTALGFRGLLAAFFGYQHTWHGVFQSSPLGVNRYRGQGKTGGRCFKES